MSSDQMPRSILMILDERARQVVEKGYDAVHDQAHGEGQLAAAGACYAMPPGYRRTRLDGAPYGWPWRTDDWKPAEFDTESRVRELVKGAALIVAEIDRLLLQDAHE